MLAVGMALVAAGGCGQIRAVSRIAALGGVAGRRRYDQ